MEQGTVWNDCRFQTLAIVDAGGTIGECDAGRTTSRRGSFEEKDKGVKHWTCRVEVPVAHPGRKAQ